MNSRHTDHRDEQSIGVPVRWILNAEGHFDQQGYDRPFLWLCMMLRDTVTPSLTSASIIKNGRIISRKQQTKPYDFMTSSSKIHTKMGTTPSLSCQRQHRLDSPSSQDQEEAGAAARAGHLHSQPTHLVAATSINPDHSRV